MTPPAPPTDLARDADALVARLVAAYPGEADPATARVVHAPGRVNLIGEHTDYNEGFVLPVAIDLGISLALVPDRRPPRRASRSPRPASAPASTSTRSAPSADAGSTTSRAPPGRWPTPGCRRAGSGRPRLGPAAGRPACRRSAALELASALALVGRRLPAVDRMTLARLAQRAENAYVGVNCGLMDQFASALRRGRQRAAARLPVAGAPRRRRCRSTRPRSSSATRGSPRRLEASAYNERRAAVRGGGRGHRRRSSRVPRCAT